MKTTQTIYKQLLDEVFVISRIIKVEGYQPKTKAEADNVTLTLIILDITKTECNNCFIMH